MKYLIKQRYLFWRHVSQGYSDNLGDAGIYDEKEAEGIRRGKREPPDVLIPLDEELREEIEEQIHTCQARIENLTKMLEALD